MPRYRRMFVSGGTYFLTVVTHGRQRFLTTDSVRHALRIAIVNTRQRMPFKIDATVLLPDHWHLMMTLPPGDDNFSARMKGIKERCTRILQQNTSLIALDFPYWQPRFWEHFVHDENDHERCFDYIHYNPVKHGIVARVQDYPWSSFHRCVREGIYPIEWGQGDVRDISGVEWD